MIYRDYGKTGKKVSVIGFGGMRFIKEEYESGAYDKCAELVKYANKLGINYFDTAPGYCDDASESIFGEAFKDMNGEFYVSTKCGLWNAKDADTARERIEKSLKKLNVPKINFYNMWCIKTMDEYKEFIKKGGIYEGAIKAKSEGLIEHICFSTHMNGDDIAKVAVDGLFEGVTLGYNAVNFAFRQQGVEACHKAGMGVVTMNPLGGGIIPTHPEYFSFIKNTDDESIAISALKFIVSQKEITAALPGISSIKEAEENIKATENLKMATDGYLEEMAKNLSLKLNTLCTGCGYCDECPVDIEIPKLMDSYNEYVLSDGNSKIVLSRLRNHWNMSGESSRNCIQCGKCEKLCTQKLPIIKRLQEIANL